jgi:hypothetical protein
MIRGTMRRDRSREKSGRDRGGAADDDQDGGPAGHAVAHQPANNRVQARGDEECQADDDEHGPRPDDQLDQAVGRRHAEGGVDAEPE